MAVKSTREPLIERRQRRVRRELATTAMEMFFQKGYDATTVEEIVDAVEISPSTFYRHFPNKCDVVVEFSRLRMRDFADALDERPVEEPLCEALAWASRAIGDDAGSDRVHLRHFEELLAKNPDLRARVRGDMFGDVPALACRIAPRLRVAGDELRNQVIAGAIASTIVLALERWHRSAEDVSPADAFRSALEVLGPLLT
jgi:AcrR family transcriptional regulator